MCHSAVPEPVTGSGSLVNSTPWSVTMRIVQRGAPEASTRMVTGVSGPASSRSPMPACCPLPPVAVKDSETFFDSAT